MKKIFLASLFMLLSIATFAQRKGFNVNVKSEVKGCLVALINKKDVGDAQYGWWGVWKSMKEKKQYKTAPAGFTNVASGKYIIVVYNPASANFDPNNGDAAQASDGVVLEEVDINKNAVFNIKKGDFKTWYCLSCPFLYIWNGNGYVKVTEVIKDIVGKKAEGTSKTKIAHNQIINNTLKIRIQEEKEETSYLNSVVLKVGNETYFPVQTSLKNTDADYLTLKKGDVVEITFEIKGNISPETAISLETTGYYEPNAEFLAEIYQKYLRSK